MYYFIGIICFVQLVKADIYLNLTEDASCEAGGVQGTCRWDWMCPSFIIPKRHQPTGCWPKECPPLPEITLCQSSEYVDALSNLVCCTDCYINDASNALLTLDGLRWNMWNTPISYQKCTEYSANLPYPSKDDKKITFNKVYDTDQKCHNLDVVWREDKPRVRPAERWELRRTKMDFPHIALLGEIFGSSFYWKCQASVISSLFLITSAQCTLMDTVLVADVVLGIDKFPQSDLTLLLNKWQRHRVKQYFTHPDYKFPFLYNDIALIRTDTEIQFGDNVLPVCLYDLPMIPETAEVDVLGVGGISNNTKVNIRKTDEKECSAIIDAMPYRKNTYYPRGIDFDIQMCHKIIDEELEISEETRREGRAIYTTGALEGMKYIVGIASHGVSSEDTNTTTIIISTPIDKFRPWIEGIAYFHKYP